jgi:uncharacterized protein with FMN-binding domain
VLLVIIGTVSDSSSHKKVANSLVALSSAAVLAVYTAGYLRTKSAADRFAVQAAVRRPLPSPPSAPAAVNTQPTTAPEIADRSAPSPPHVSRRGTRVERGPVDRNVRERPARSKSPVTSATTTTAAELPVSVPPSPSASLPELPPVAIEQGPVAAPMAPPPPAKTQYKDGTYYGWGTSRHGDIQAAVVIQDGRIASATIAQCLTRYSCSVIAKLPPQVAERQSPETDYVSGATQSTNAFYYAVVEALSKAK